MASVSVKDRGLGIEKAQIPHYLSGFSGRKKPRIWKESDWALSVPTDYL